MKHASLPLPLSSPASSGPQSRDAEESAAPSTYRHFHVEEVDAEFGATKRSGCTTGWPKMSTEAEGLVRRADANKAYFDGPIPFVRPHGSGEPFQNTITSPHHVVGNGDLLAICIRPARTARSDGPGSRVRAVRVVDPPVSSSSAPTETCRVQHLS